ncbi:helix-turn-helix transcriptional regulator [Campylobacter geochelonis]|uniref:helix-turn-helix transcriptional regulator n=1 Tax=Campylobacter geochelonis TaxID=1780362 RepID=UPI003BF4609D
MIELLLCGEKLSIAELSEEFNVSARTIRRDLKQRIAHLPVVCENGFYFLDYTNYNIKKYDLIKFSKKSGIFGLYPDDNYADIQNNNSIKIVGFEYEKIDTTLFKTAKSAIENNQSLKFDYKDKKRIVNPYKLINLHGIWYLCASENDKLKNFTFKNIKELVVEGCFEKNTKFERLVDGEISTFPSENLTTIKLKASKNIKEFLLRRKLFPEQKIIEDAKGGWLIFETKVGFLNDIKGVIRYWMPEIFVLEPLWLKDEFLNELQIYLEKERKCCYTC